MAFFSKIKKLWTRKDKAEAPETPLEGQEHLDASAEAQIVLEPDTESVSEPISEPIVGAESESVPESAAESEPVSLPVSPAAPPEVFHAAPSDATSTPEPEPTPEDGAEPLVVTEGWQKELTLSLREAEPRLSVWLELVIGDVQEAGDELWERLSFLFKALEAPEDEAQAFIKKFEAWREDMDYVRVEEFKSELQYRLALALDLEDEEDERSRLFLKLSEGLAKTRESITKQIDGLLSAHESIDDDFWEELEEILIMADVGYDAAMQLTSNLKDRAKKNDVTDPAQFKELMREELEEIFKTGKKITAYNPPEVVLVIGVNGVGKTTTIAKLAHREAMRGRKVLIAAGDTFRAAAIGQLEIWAKRVGAGFFAKEANSDPAAVAYEAMDKAVKEGYDVLFVDTAGRLHTKVNLMDELCKINNVLGKKHEGAPHRRILVLDSTTGQNALSQTKLFNEAVSIDEIVLTKLDGTAKGGVVVAVALQFGIPITFIGLGEQMEDLRPFDGKDFAQALLT